VLVLSAVLNPAADAAAAGRDQDVLGSGLGTAAAARGGNAADEPPAKRVKREPPIKQQQQEEGGGIKQQRVYSQLQVQVQQQQPSQQHPPWQVINACNALGNGLGAAFLQSDYWLEVPEQLQETLCDEFPVGLICSSPVGNCATAGGRGVDGSSCGIPCFTASSFGGIAPAAVPAVYVVDALGREVAIGGVQLPVLLHLCGSGNSVGTALCIDLLLLLAAARMQQGDLDSLAEKLAVKMISLAQISAEPGPGPGRRLAGPGTVEAGHAAQVWHNRLENILSKSAVKQQLLQHQNKVQHLQKLLSLL
jgi:hypothetical protein